MRNVRKIHFINRIDRDNAGDWNCSPLEYYYWFFKNYNIIRHDIGSIDYNEIDRDDVVIFGGGGLFNVLEPFNQAIIRVLSLCDHVIAWSCEFNTHNERLQSDTDHTPIDIDKFMLATIRDYGHPSNIEYLPCPSVKALIIDKGRKPLRKYGVLFHRNLSEISQLPFDSISNNESITRINDFILDSEAIITNSYHGAYWALLLERKVIVVNKFSTKFDWFKYKPESVEISLEDKEKAVSVIDCAFEKAPVYKGIMEEAENLNDDFFDRVKEVIKGLEFPESNDYSGFYLLNKTRDLRFDNLHGEVLSLNDSVMWLYEKLDKIVQLEQSNLLKQQAIEKKLTEFQTFISNN